MKGKPKPKLTRGVGHMGKSPTPKRPQQMPDAFARKKPPTGLR
jgi:hypothetical protein